MNKDEAVQIGIELYLASKGKDESFIKKEIIPLLRAEVKRKIANCEYDEMLGKYTGAFMALEEMFVGLGSEEVDDDFNPEELVSEEDLSGITMRLP
jgi:hypothetical protein